jgi:HD superfamily phosphodiesterase
MRSRSSQAITEQTDRLIAIRSSSLAPLSPSSHAEGLLEPLATRWAHIQAVAEQASRIAPAVLPADERETLIVVAWLHDIGYAPALATTGLHPLDGARHLETLGVDRRLCCLVAHHSGATFEAEERGHAAELAAFEQEHSPVMDALS